MKIKVSEATGTVLDWVVAKCLGRGPEKDMDAFGGIWRGWWLTKGGEYERMPAYSTDWQIGGPIIEREGISLLYLYVTDDPFRWAATQKPTLKNVKPDAVYGPTPLIAAMRCLCARELGDEVEVPDELA